MTRSFACIIAIAGWYLLYPPAIHKGNPDSYTALSQWNIDGSYGSAVDCHEARRDDLNALRDWTKTLPISSKPKPANVLRPTIPASHRNQRRGWLSPASIYHLGFRCVA